MVCEEDMIRSPLITIIIIIIIIIIKLYLNAINI